MKRLKKAVVTSCSAMLPSGYGCGVGDRSFWESSRARPVNGIDFAAIGGPHFSRKSSQVPAASVSEPLHVIGYWPVALDMQATRRRMSEGAAPLPYAAMLHILQFQFYLPSELTLSGLSRVP